MATEARQIHGFRKKMIYRSTYSPVVFTLSHDIVYIISKKAIISSL